MNRQTTIRDGTLVACQKEASVVLFRGDVNQLMMIEKGER